jgi:hypothetical protein
LGTGFVFSVLSGAEVDVTSWTEELTGKASLVFVESGAIADRGAQVESKKTNRTRTINN